MYWHIRVNDVLALGSYLLSIGCVIIGRIFYVILLFSYIFGFEGFPSTFWWTGVADLIWSILYIVITLKSDEIHLKDLFIPHRGENGLV
jgi:hypothetical protein